MALFKIKSLSLAHEMDHAEEDQRNSARVEQYRISDKAIHFPAFPGNQYLPFAALSRIKVRDTALSVTGTCGKQLPMTCLRMYYDGEFYKDFLFEKRTVAEKVLEKIRKFRPELELDIAAPSGLLDR